MDLYEQYAVLQKEIDALETKKKVLRDEIASVLPDEGVKNDFVTAVWRKAKKWAYPETVTQLETEVKEKIKPIEEKFQEEIRPFVESVETAKKLAEENGTATAEETKSLVVTLKK